MELDRARDVPLPARLVHVRDRLRPTLPPTLEKTHPAHRSVSGRCWTGFVARPALERPEFTLRPRFWIRHLPKGALSSPKVLEKRVLLVILVAGAGRTFARANLYLPSLGGGRPLVKRGDRPRPDHVSSTGASEEARIDPATSPPRSDTRRPKTPPDDSCNYEHDAGAHPRDVRPSPALRAMARPAL